MPNGAPRSFFGVGAPRVPRNGRAPSTYTAPVPIALETRSLTKRFGDVVAVRDLSLRVPSGEIYGLLGPNGSGKTTTLACALGLMRPTDGHALVLGTPAHRIAETRGAVSVVFDGSDLVDELSARQNLEFARRLLGRPHGRGTQEVLELVGLTALARRRAARLSLGERRRLAVARALLGDPRLLVLDEPLSGLDPAGVRTMLALFRTLAGEGRTLFLSSHRLRELETVLTRGAILSQGRLAAEGTLAELTGADRPRLRVRATPLERAREVLSTLETLRVVSEEQDLLTIELRNELDGGLDGAGLNRRLVEAGCDVHELAPERRDLASAFDLWVARARETDRRQELRA